MLSLPRCCDASARTRQRQRKTSWWILAGVAAWPGFRFLLGGAGSRSQRASVADESFQNYTALYADAPACTFDDLLRSFPNPNLLRRQRDNNQDEHDPQRTKEKKQQCWKLEDELVRVPTTAILNRNHLKKLGHGKAGAVFRALVQLKNHETNHGDNQEEGNNNPNVCYCALKTDLCQESLWQSKADSVSCVKDGSYLLKGFSFLMGEITGMLVPYAYWRRGKEPPSGLLPNLAVVEADSRKQALWVPSFWGYRARDTSIIGVLMPLRKFHSVFDLKHSHDDNLFQFHRSLPEIARVMLPAARALETLHAFGLVHQDMHSGNIVIDDATGTSLLSDLGLVGKLVDNCTASQDMCNFCVDRGIGQRRFPHDTIEGMTPMESDAHRLARLIGKYFVPKNNTALQEELLACREASRTVQILEGWLKKEGP